MIFGICCAAAVITTILQVIGFEMVQGWGDCWIPVLLVLGNAIGFILLHFLIALILSLLINTKKEVKTEKAFYRIYMEQTIDLLLLLLRVHCQVNGREKLPNSRFLMVSNHLSMFDPLVCIACLSGTKISYISKSSICIRFTTTRSSPRF